MLELTPDLTKKLARFNELSKQAAPDLDEAINIYLELAGTTSGVPALSEDHTDALLKMLDGREITPPQAQALTEVCLHAMAAMKDGTHQPHVPLLKVTGLAKYLVDRAQPETSDLSSARI